MKPNDKAIKAALRATSDSCSAYQIQNALDAAYAAQFQSDDYAEIIDKLRDDYQKTVELCAEAADAFEALLAERDALNFELAARKEWPQARAEMLDELAKVRAERDALAARLAPVDDEALVEIAADAISTYVPDQVSKWGSIKDAAIDAIAAIRPHIEVAERERCVKAVKKVAGRINVAHHERPEWEDGYLQGVYDAAAAIRSGK